MNSLSDAEKAIVEVARDLVDKNDRVKKSSIWAVVKHRYPEAVDYSVYSKDDTLSRRIFNEAVACLIAVDILGPAFGRNDDDLILTTTGKDLIWEVPASPAGAQP